MKSVVIHDQAYSMYKWQELGDDILSLAEKILDDYRKNEKPKHDRVIALAKGGLTFSRSLIDYLQVKNYSSIQIEFYNSIAQTNRTPVITQSLATSIRNEHVLVFDDIADTGETLKMATQYFNYHGAASVTTAVLVTKPWSNYQPDYFSQTSDAWIIFPNEVRETIELLQKKWLEMGDSLKKIHSQLIDIGFTKRQVDLFSSTR